MLESRDYDLRRTCNFVGDALSSGESKPEEFSVRDLFENLVRDRNGDCIGREVLREMDPRQNSSGVDFVEAGNAIDTSAFSNITGQIVYNKILEAYNDPAFLWSQLLETIPTDLNGEKIAGIGRLGDNAETVDEGMVYPTVGTQEEWIETPATTKRGFIVPVTKEAIFFDRTGLVLRRASETGNWLGVNKEKRCLDVATGQTNNYKYKGTAYNTYYASGDSGPWTNKIVDVLTDWTDINAAEQLWESMTDPVTGEPIVLSTTRQLLVPGALTPTAMRIVNATEVRYDPNASAGTANEWIIGGNPIGQIYSRPIILSNPWVYARTSSAVNWFYGDFKRAFAYMENWSIQTTQAPANSEAEFSRDIVQQYKVSERGVAAVMDPHYVVMSAGTG
jgi:hypothetical protein